MDFTIPDVNNDIKQLSNSILMDHAEPERLKNLEANGPYFDKEVWNKLVESGIHSASLPEDLGGLGLDFAASAMVCEELGRSMISIPFIPCVISSVLPLLNAIEQAPVKAAIDAFVAGDNLLTTAFIESGNEDCLAPNTQASVNGDSCSLTGTKHCVPYAQFAGHVLVSAISEGQLLAALVDLTAANIDITEQLATSQEPQCQLSFKNTAAHVVAQGDAAVALFQQAQASTSAAYSAMACGVADKMMRIAGEYTSQREQFGVPIATFQAVAHRLADAYIDVECLKIITLKATNDVNMGDYGNESIAMAKVWTGDVLHRVSQASQHVHGGMGIDKDYHLFRYCLWAKQLELSLGCSKVHIQDLANRLEQHYLANS